MIHHHCLVFGLYALRTLHTSATYEICANAKAEDHIFCCCFQEENERRVKEKGLEADCHASQLVHDGK